MKSPTRQRAKKQRQLQQRMRQLEAATVDASALEHDDSILEVSDLRTTFDTDDGFVTAVNNVSIRIRRGATTCIVGESGSGKSVLMRSILQLVDNPGEVESGRALFRPAPSGPVYDLLSMSPTGEAIRSIRGADVGMIFQEPMSSLSPVHTIGNQISEVLQLHTDLPPKAIRQQVIEELARVGIPNPADRVDAYGFQLSGGQRQRAMIAMALVTRPALLIADEPTTALDVTTQAQVLDLLGELKGTLDMSVIFITHDLGVVAEIADDVIVMCRGEVVESGTVDQIFHDPQHAYTKMLLDSLPQRLDMPGTGPGSGGKGHRKGTMPTAGVQAASPLDPEGDDAPTGRAAPLLEVRDLRVEFQPSGRNLFRKRSRDKVVALNGVDLQVERGSVMGLVGESGCGKTTLGRAVLRALDPDTGSILYRPDAAGEPVDLVPLSHAELRPYRRDIRMVFQDPYSSLNPRMTVGQNIGEALRMMGVRQAEINSRVEEMLERVGLRRGMINRYPNAFSGGERQRICIARALITEPELIVADEAVSALDVSIRAQVLELLAELQRELDLTFLFISHDLSVVERISDRVAVMYYGDIVEEGTAQDVFSNPQHLYTQALLSAVPLPDPRLRGTQERIVFDPALAAS